VCELCGKEEKNVKVFVDSFVDVSGSATVGRKKHYWDFSERFGPLFTTAEGEPLVNQPGPRTAAWKAFEAWLADLYQERSKVTNACRIGRI
jgi:hypothetical protein